MDLTQSRRRTPDGTPAGGQFAPETGSKPARGLTAPDDTQEWATTYAGRRWTDNGFDAAESQPWRDAEFTSDEAEEWRAEGWEVEDAMTWRNGFAAADATMWRNECICFDDARQYRAADIAPAAAKDFIEAKLDPDTASQWVSAQKACLTGIEPAYAGTAASDWDYNGFTPSTYRDWAAADFSRPCDAAAWRGNRFTAEQAHLWSRANFGPYESSEWREAGFEPARADYWATRGFDAHTARTEQVYGRLGRTS
jgi:hypothetical protein